MTILSKQLLRAMGGGTQLPLRSAAATNFANRASTAVATNGATTVDVYNRVFFVIGATVPDIVLGIQNSFLAANSGVTVPGNGFTITAMSIEIGSVTTPVLFSGSRSASVANGQNLLSDPVSPAAFSLANFPQGQSGWVRYQFTFSTPATDKICNSVNLSSNDSSFRFANGKVNVTNGVDGVGAFAYTMINGGVNGTDAVSNAGYLRPIILGRHTQSAIGLWGDSKTQGVGDTPNATGAQGMGRTLYPSAASTTGAKPGINFGCSGGVANDCLVAVGAASLSMLTDWYQYLTHAVVGYGTNGSSTTTQTNLWAQIRTKGVQKIIQRSLTPRTTIPNTSITQLTRVGTAVTGTMTSTAGITSGNQYQISGAVPSQYNGVFAITVVDATTFTYTALTTPGTSPATGTIVMNTGWADVASQTPVAGWAFGGAIDTFEAFLRAAPTTDPDMTYYQSQGERQATSGANYWIWKATGVPLRETADGIHESASGYEDNITTGTATTQAGGTVSASLRSIVQAL